MIKFPSYSSPYTEWSELDSLTLICDSYNSEIEDYDYEEINW